MQRRTLVASALVAPWAAPLLARPAQAQDGALLDAARREGSLTWFNGYIGDTIAQTMAGLFERAHPGIKVNTIRSTSQVAFQRLRQDQQAGLHNCDVYSSSDISHFDDLQREKRLMFYTPANAAKLDPALRGKTLWVDGQYYPALISMMAPLPTTPSRWPQPRRHGTGPTCLTRSGAASSRSGTQASAAMPAPGRC